MRSLIVDYPSSKSLSLKWNLGSFLFVLTRIQILSGIFLLFFFIPRELEAFFSVDFLTRERTFGVVFRSFHLNGASLIFVFLYLHLTRGIYFFSFRLTRAWLIGRLILILIMIAAFLGYVLPIGQMSFWGATVITNLISTLPYIGREVVLWIWGGYRINKASLSLFFVFHFLVPFIIIIIVFFHLLFLHSTRRTSLVLVHERFSKVKFHPYYIYKDVINLFFLLFLLGLCLFSPWSLGDPENWTKANPISSPVHIQPEWYFLFAYAILRCVPRKLGGVVALVSSVLVIPLLCLNTRYLSKIKWLSKIFIFLIIVRFFVLTWLGGCAVEGPYILISQVFSLIYFFRFGFLLI